MYAAELAQEHSAALYLLHVVRRPPAAEPALSFGEAEAAARTKLEQIGHRKVKAGTGYELLVVSGDAAGEILHSISQLGIDLIVMATHGRRGVRRLVLGSVAEPVVREAHCPVLTIKPNTVGGGPSRKRAQP